MKNYFFKGSAVLMVLAVFSMLAINSCNDDPDPDPILVEDGLYVKGAGTALDSLTADGMMAQTKNEVLQEKRNSLYELYIAIEGGSEGFNLVNVEGGAEEVWGPGSDFAAVAAEDLDGEEPGQGLWRGGYTVSETVFTVPEDGLYHVVVDTELGVAAIAKVEWGMIGGATPNGWGGSTPLTADFDLNSMEFSATDVELRLGEFKYRYSDGWKIILDTIVDNGEDNGKGVKVNTNFGGTITALEAGGDNIQNDQPGFYTATITWTLGEGHTASLEKTGDIAVTDWTGVKVDMVGDGVSADNPNATEDTSGWNWGNVLVADNNGEPTVSGSVYTWTWDAIVIEADAGFKIRSLNGEAPPSGGANFDVGYGAVDAANSSALVADKDGNMSVTTKGTFDFVLEIDAANNDEKKVVITETVVK